MEGMLKKIKSNTVLSSGLCAALGVVLVLWPGLSIQLVCKAVGVVLIVCGLLRLISFFIEHDGSMYTQSNLVLGIIFAVVGIWIVANPGRVLSLIPIIVGILIVIHGISNLQQAITLCKSKYSRWWLALLLAVLTLGLGCLLIFKPFAAIDTVVMLIGLFLIYDGVSNIWIVSRIAKSVKMAKQEAGAVDVEAREIK